jgi:hypothetical protein
MSDRKLKVYHSFRSSDKKAVPEVRLIGQWLEQSGFKIGEQVQVTIKDQEIIIKPFIA